jgi:hypothetical protein
LKVNTKGYGGRQLKKNIRVHTNDPKQPIFTLVIVGSVEKFATINPPSVSLRGFVGDSISKSVSIIPEEKYAFKITKARARSGKNIKLRIEEVENAGRREYALFVENLKQEKGRYSDLIILETDSKIKPKFNLRVYGHLRARPVQE